MNRHLVVSFHDLHPGSMACCIRFLDRLKALGIPEACLLTVPNWYGSEPLGEHPEFCAWLRGQPHDISLHGWAHVAGHRRRKPIEWLIANRYTAGEGEFFKLPDAQAEELIVRGLEVFREAGISPNGFIAPAWLMEESLLPVLERTGFSYAVTLNRLFDISRRRELRAPVLCCTSRTPLRRALTRQVISALSAMHRNEPVLRVAVHPVDFQYPAIETFTYRLIARLLEDRRPITYAQLIEPAP
jgi:predicted deacetylase